MAYDAGTGRLILFGGRGKSGVLANTWDWNGTTWTLLHPTPIPSAREGAALTYEWGLEISVFVLHCRRGVNDQQSACPGKPLRRQSRPASTATRVR